jgi:AcrR family transcriptional regulator
MAKPLATNRVGTPAQGRELRARGQRTVRKLLDAGISVFGTKGFHAARVDDIVKVAKTSHGTFYLYFANKEDLFRALALDVAEELRLLFESLGPLTGDDEGYDALHDWLGRFAALHHRYAPVIRAWTEAEMDASEFGDLGSEVVAGFASTLAEHIAASPATVDDPQLAALALVAMIERCSYYSVSGQVPGVPDGVVDTLTEITHTALFGTRTGTRG